MVKRCLPAIAVVFGLLGCATPIGVTKISPQEARRALTANALTTGKPSAASTQFLYRLDLSDRFKKDPAGALAELYAGLGQADEQDRLLALAELSLIHATDSGDQAYDLAAAAYAWAFLFPAGERVSPDRYDRRVSQAMGIYNRALIDGLAYRDGNPGNLDLKTRSVSLPFGSLQLDVDPASLRYGGYQLTEFTPLADFKVRGLRNRYQQQGLGAAVAANVAPSGDQLRDKWIPPRGSVPVTVLLRFDNPLQQMSDGRLHGDIEIFDTEADLTTTIDGGNAPLATDPSAALAYRLESDPVWDSEIAGFRRGDFRAFGVEGGGGLFMLRPYQPGRIPIVFVHGTASSPARWAEMANEILGDQLLSRRYQIWFFMYNTGNPIVYSAMKLRESLQAAVKDIDPQGRDPSLRQITVLIGHSQGGLLVKMTMVDSGTRFWDARSKVPFESADLSPEVRDLARRALFVEPLPFVKRGIFIATPHKGSFVADSFFGNLGRRLISLPGDLTRLTGDLAGLEPKDPMGTTGIPTSVDNMKSSNTFIKILSSLPIAPGVHANSIIAVNGDGPAEVGNDGVVTYHSAHIDGVESELVVRSSHSTQGTPATIEEVRRILYLNLEEP